MDQVLLRSSPLLRCSVLKPFPPSPPFPLAIVVATVLFAGIVAATHQQPAQAGAGSGLEFIDTSFENASPLWYDVADGVVRFHLLYDHERASPNRAAGHIHFLLHARPGQSSRSSSRTSTTSGTASPVRSRGELKTVAISADGRTWKTVPTESLPGDRVQLTVEMPGPRLYVARIEPYRLSDLDRFLASIRTNRLVQITPIGKTAGGPRTGDRRVGDADAPYRVFLRARAHPWEPGGNWVVQGLSGGC